jgi:peptide chain release factor 3
MARATSALHDSAARPMNFTSDALALAHEVARRRTFAIISHPDAGKTTLTEKLLLYGGAIHEAGSVKSRRAARHAMSDWMAIEQERGISITASVLQLEYAGFRINLLDTPGHEDFSEDTYRALTAADSAIMLLDNRKGVEARTRQLFNVCRKRRLPIFTFVNKCDRAGVDPLELIDHVQRDLGLRCFAYTWPIMREGRLVGLVDRSDRTVHVYRRADDHGATRSDVAAFALGDPALAAALEPEVLSLLREQLGLLDEAGEAFDMDGVARGDASPVFFGSALTNVGVDLLLGHFLRHAPPPSARESDRGLVDPVHAPFSGFVFKIQANMDPRHRDRVAFLRVCSGRFEAGMSATVSRTGRTLRLARPQEFFGGERSHGDTAVAGDVVGLHERGELRVGDTLSVEPLEYPGVPRFSPEHFAQVRLDAAMRRKQLDKGVRHLAEEGTVLLLYSEGLAGPVPIVGAVGRLQFDVLIDRLRREYGVEVSLERLPYCAARWVQGPESEIQRLAGGFGIRRVRDADGQPMVLFESEWALARAIEREKKLRFDDVQPGTSRRRAEPGVPREAPL